MQRVYRRTNARDPIPAGVGLPDVALNRLGLFWRPLIDMRDSEFAPLRLRLVEPVAAMLTTEEDRWSWCSQISVPGLRHQVVRHAGLTTYECPAPSRLPEELQTETWQRLVAAIDGFDSLDWRRRALVVFQLAQLSFHRLALGLADRVTPADNPDYERFRYDVGRVAASTPGCLDRALRVFGELAEGAADPLLRVAAAFQGIGHSLRANELGASRFERIGTGILATCPAEWRGWVGDLVRSRFHRALALLRKAGNELAQAKLEAEKAHDFHIALAARCADRTDLLVARENERYLLECTLSLTLDAPVVDKESVERLCARLYAIDPHCVQARTTIGDAWLALDRVREAARWYEYAGELGTGAGAVAWFRAGQCHRALGDPAAAANAMGRCLELDGNAIEPRDELVGLTAVPFR